MFSTKKLIFFLEFAETYRAVFIELLVFWNFWWTIIFSLTRSKTKNIRTAILPTQTREEFKGSPQLNPHYAEWSTLHNERPIEGSPWTPSYHSAVMFEGLQESPQLVPHDAESRYSLGELKVWSL